MCSPYHATVALYSLNFTVFQTQHSCCSFVTEHCTEPLRVFTSALHNCTQSGNGQRSPISYSLRSAFLFSPLLRVRPAS